MAFDVEAAKADGYTDEEINAYLQSQNNPQGQQVPPQEPIDRTAEYAGTVLGAGAGAAKVAAGAYGVKKAADVVGGLMNRGQTPPAQPIAPVQPSAPVNPPTTSPSYTMPAQRAESGSIMNQARNIVQKLALDKVLKGAGIAGGAYELGKGLFYTSPEDIATLKAAEQRRKQGLQ